MSKKHNQAGDVAHTLVNTIAEQLDHSDLKKREDISLIMQKILSQILNKPVRIYYKRLPRNFPQLFTEDSMLIIRCFYSKGSSNSSKWKNLSLQLSVAAVLACCPASFVDNEISVDETFCSFSRNCPDLANLANKLCHLIHQKITAEYCD